MSNPKATNAYINIIGNNKNYLQVDKQNVPVDKQVPLSYTIYNGLGNEILLYDGSSVIVVDSTLPNGPLTVSFGGTVASNRNWFGRRIEIVVPNNLLNEIVLDYTPGTIFVSGTGNAGNIYHVPILAPHNALVLFYSENTLHYSTNGTPVPVPPIVEGFSVGLLNNQNAPSGIDQVIFDDDVSAGRYNIGGLYNTGTGICTILNTGTYKYDLTLSAEINLNIANSHMEIQLLKNGNDLQADAGLFYPAAFNDVAAMHFSGTLQAAAGDQFRVVFRGLATPTKNIIATPYTLFSFYRIQ